MKQIILTIGLIVALSAVQNAQTPGPASRQGAHQGTKESLTPEQRARKDADRAAAKLALSKEQKAQWESAALERAKSNEPIREKMKGCTTPQERKDYHAQMKENGKKFNTTVVSLLTPEQKTNYEQLKKERRSRKHKMHRGTEAAPDEQNRNQN